MCEEHNPFFDMTRIDFYTRAPDRLDVVRKLVQKAHQGGQQILVYTRDEHLAERLDAYLWSVPNLSFLPHVRCGHSLSGETPVLIGAQADGLARLDVLINLDREPPQFFSRFERLLEVVGNEPDDIQMGRERYRYYKERGYDLKHNDLSGKGA